MLSTHPSVLAITALLSKHLVGQIVICPGSRNAPLAQSLSQSGQYDCYSVVDERSAAFFALGLHLSSQRPVAVCCTSGTALLNMASAAAEAYYQGIPLIIISADRPEAIIDQLDDQTVRQAEALRPFVKRTVHIPEPLDEQTTRYGERLINDALSYATYRHKGPVHINIPISEPLFDFSATEVPSINPIIRPHEAFGSPMSEALLQKLYTHWTESKKRMILIGQLPSATGARLSCILEQLCQVDDSTVILMEHPANVLGSKIGLERFDEILYAADQETLSDLSPDLLITIGGHTLSKRLKQWLRTYPPIEHYSFSPDGEIHDTFGALRMVIDTDGSDFLGYLCTASSTARRAHTRSEQQAYASLWTLRQGLLHPLKANALQQWTDLDIMGSIFEAMTAMSKTARGCMRWHLHLGNSSTVRNAQHLRLPPSVSSVQSNRGTSGIDGSLSTAVGAAAWFECQSNRKPPSTALELHMIDSRAQTPWTNEAIEGHDFVLCILGDLSFFYDMNALWGRHLNSRLRIVLMNNGGGQIFHALPGLQGQPTINDYIAHAHTATAEAWSLSCGLEYRSVRSAADLEEATTTLLDPAGNAPVLIEVFTDMDTNTQRLREYYHNQRKGE